jgi:hypothetical protein
MSDEHEVDTKHTPWHFWVTGVVALLWSGMGAFDYAMTQTKNEAYLSQFPPEILAFVDGMPAWAIATWAIAVWGGVVGALLLLFKRRQAITAFLVSLLAMLVTTFQNYVLSNGLEIMGDTFTLVFTAAIILLSVAFFLYARAMRELLT